MKFSMEKLLCMDGLATEPPRMATNWMILTGLRLIDVRWRRCDMIVQAQVSP